MPFPVGPALDGGNDTIDVVADDDAVSQSEARAPARSCPPCAPCRTASRSKRARKLRRRETDAASDRVNEHASLRRGRPPASPARRAR